MASRERTEVTQDKRSPTRVCISLIENVSPTNQLRSTLRVDKKHIRTLIKQLKAWL